VPHEKPPKVSVCVLAYNHENYIRQCLQSIVEQEVDFDFEVIVGADSSSDNTHAIVREFVETHPGVVSAIFRNANIGGTRNYVATHALARGEYVAHIDGDDLMLPGKLRVQATFLSDNPDFVGVWHRMKTIAEDGYAPDPAPVTAIEPVTQRVVLQRGFAGYHSSLMYRRDKKPILRSSGDILDLHISVELLKNGLGAILPDVLGVYRKGVGVMANDREGVRRLVTEMLDHYLGLYPEYRSEINRCAFSLFVREALTGSRGAMRFLHTFLISLTWRTPLSVCSECISLARSAFTRLYSYLVNR